MKNKYSWCFPLPEDKIKEIWDEAILTVDSNVLLDLYRYHKTTREALIEAIKKFEGRLWLSHQAAEEFFRNRKKTIVSSVSSYDSAIKKIREMNEVVSGPLSDLKKNRVSGMPFLAYTTDRFFSFSQKLGGQQSNQKAEEEITQPMFVLGTAM